MTRDASSVLTPKSAGYYLPLANERANEADAPMKRMTAQTAVQILGLSVGRPMPQVSPDGTSGPGMGRMLESGTALTLYVSNPKRRLIGFDPAASRIVVLSDDKHVDLTRPNGRPHGSSAEPFAVSIEPDGHSCLVRVSVPHAPSPGVTRIQLDAEVVLRCGMGQDILEQPVELLSGADLFVGPTTVALKSRDDQLPFGDAKTLVEMTADQPLDVIKSVAFLGPNGKPVQHRDVGGDCLALGGKTTYQAYYGLAEEVDSVTVRIVHYVKVELLKVPVSLETGIGF